MIEITNISTITTSFKSCRFSNGCAIEAKVGRLSLSLPSSTSTLYFRKNSGNGLIQINGVEYVVNSAVSCEITIDENVVNISRPHDSTGVVTLFGIKYADESKKRSLKYDLYQHRKPPTGLIRTSTTSVISTISTKSNQPMTNQIRRTNPPIEPKNLVLYDSIIAHGFDRAKITQTNTVKHLKSNGLDLLAIKTGGSFTIPTSFAQSNTTYIVSIKAKRISGNGKIQIGFVHANRFIQEGVAALIENQELIVGVSSGTAPPSGDQYRLTISMPDTSSGEIIIYQLKILDGLPIPQAKHTNKITVNTSETALPPTTTYQFSHYDSITQSTIKNSIITKQEYVPPAYYDATGCVRTDCFSASQWLAKILPLFPNLKVHTDSAHMIDGTSEQPMVAISCLGSLKPCDRIWVEEFQGIVPDKIDEKILNVASVIMSPSIPNVQMFRQMFPNKMVIHVPKFWPMLHNQDEQNVLGRYVVMFEKNPIMTNAVVQIWSDAFPTLIVIGARSNLPKFVKPISPYLPYEDIFRLMRNAECFIDLSHVNHYSSGVLDLAHSCGISIVTNNHWLKLAKPTPEYVASKYFVDGILLPGSAELKISIEKALAKKHHRNVVEHYNHNLDATVRTLLGVM